MFSLAAAILCASSLLARGSSLPLKLVLLDEAAKSAGAKCLDGSPGGYYWRQATSQANATKYLLVFNGGGWCRSLEDCAARSHTNLGSSTKWSSSINGEGITSTDPGLNPGFNGWNVAYLYYCDGTSYSSNNATTSSYGSQQLYFRGRRILDGFLEDLKANRGLDKATEVLLSGHSAGGLGAYLQGDHVGDFVKANAAAGVKYGVAPDAGWFMPLPQATTGNNYYHDYIVEVLGVLGNSSGWVNEGCVAAQAGPGGDPHQCLFAENVFQYTKYDYMPVQSSYDSWQLPNIIDLKCLPPKCNATELAIAQGFHSALVASMTKAGALPPGVTRPQGASRRGSSAWVISCVSHSEMYYGDYF